ncbi:MAG: sulfite exporter TauE/SafE family protein [Ilumatobacteraceae bacterium]
MSAFTLADHLIAAVAAAGAGAVNAIAGGGTLISFPALVALGAGRVSANVTNTVALCPGYFGGAVAQRSQLPGQRSRLVRLSVAAAIGGLTGSVLLLATGEAAFTKLVPWLILMACALLGGQNYIRKWLGIGTRPHGAPSTVAVGSVFVVSIYGGYFGAGLGIALLAVLGLVIDESLPRLNALKQVLALVINVVAACFFAGSGHVIWSLVAVMAPASLIGGIAGGKLVTKIQPKVLRGAVVTYGTVLAVYYLAR